MKSRAVRCVAVLTVAATLATGCAGTSTPIAADPEPTSTSAPVDPPAPVPALPDKPTPMPYVPAGQPGTAQDYNELIERLAQEIPSDLRAAVPWPDLRNPDPIVAQIEIFELWIWMAANYPDPILVQAMTAPGSPSREEVVSVFGNLDRSGNLEIRTGAGYQAFEHQVVTFESSGLPLWLARDVPEDAVVVYYADSSGPTEVRDRESRALIEKQPAVGTRAWLSIMVPTNVGWQLFRDQLIEPNDPELQVPESQPGNGDDRPLPEV